MGRNLVITAKALMSSIGPSITQYTGGSMTGYHQIQMIIEETRYGEGYTFRHSGGLFEGEWYCRRLSINAEY